MPVQKTVVDVNSEGFLSENDFQQKLFKNLVYVNTRFNTAVIRTFRWYGPSVPQTPIEVTLRQMTTDPSPASRRHPCEVHEVNDQALIIDS